MSLNALSKVFNCEMEPVNKLVMVFLADICDENNVAVPNFEKLARKVGVSVEDLRRMIDGLIYVNALEPVPEHPFDMFEGTEGFRLHVDALDLIPDLESTWSKKLRLVGGD